MSDDADTKSPRIQLVPESPHRDDAAVTGSPPDLDFVADDPSVDSFAASPEPPGREQREPISQLLTSHGYVSVGSAITSTLHCTCGDELVVEFFRSDDDPRFSATLQCDTCPKISAGNGASLADAAEIAAVAYGLRSPVQPR